MDLRARLKRLLPPDALNWLMLNFPIVYKFPIVSFESNMDDEAIEDIGCLLAATALLSGDVIECGSSRCGTSIYIARHLESLGIKKPIHALDSYEGFDRGGAGARALREGLRMLQTIRSPRPATATLSENLKDSATMTPFSPYKGSSGIRSRCWPLKRGFRSLWSIAICKIASATAPIRYGRVWFRERWSHSMTMLRTSFRGARLAVDAFVSGQTDDISSHGMLNRLYYARKTGGQG